MFEKIEITLKRRGFAATGSGDVSPYEISDYRGKYFTHFRDLHKRNMSEFPSRALFTLPGCGFLGTGEGNRGEVAKYAAAIGDQNMRRWPGGTFKERILESYA
jgi:hypothetical protein